MRIAFITFEYPPDTAWGGIATYADQAARALRAAGHGVEVFTATSAETRSIDVGGIIVHRISGTDTDRFREEAGLAFSKRHAEAPFDVVEGPDFNADARDAVRLVPDIPLVVKLHTPRTFVFRITYGRPSWLRRKLTPRTAWLSPAVGSIQGETTFEADAVYARKVDEIEHPHVFDADEVSAPCHAIARAARAIWNVPRERLHVVPYVFVAPPELLAIGPPPLLPLVTFIGRLESRKGVLELADAIPLVIERHPEAKFRFVGGSVSWPRPGITMQEHLQERLQKYEESVSFDGEIAPEQIGGVLASTQICVFPSRWENFPFVCLEAMAAGRAIVGSSAGGMFEMLNRGAGELVPPGHPKRIAAAIDRLLTSFERREGLAQRARARVLDAYCARAVVPLMEAGYARAINRRRRLGARAT